jgi:large subunit ribosomal protein L23
MSKFYDILVAPIITEQSNKLIEGHNKYTFRVLKSANKVEIKKAVESIFNVTVLNVNTINVKPKFKRTGKYEGYTQAYKKAVVKLPAGQKIDAFTV